MLLPHHAHLVGVAFAESVVADIAAVEGDRLVGSAVGIDASEIFLAVDSHKLTRSVRHLVAVCPARIAKLIMLISDFGIFAVEGRRRFHQLEARIGLVVSQNASHGGRCNHLHGGDGAICLLVVATVESNVVGSPVVGFHIAPFGIGVVHHLCGVVGHINQVLSAAIGLKCLGGGHHIERVGDGVFRAIDTLIPDSPKFLHILIFSDGGWHESHAHAIFALGENALNGKLHIGSGGRVFDAEFIDASHRRCGAVGIGFGDGEFAVSVNIVECHGFKCAVIVFVSGNAILESAEIAREVERLAIAIAGTDRGWFQPLYASDNGNAVHFALHASPAGRNVFAHLVFGV